MVKQKNPSNLDILTEESLYLLIMRLAGKRLNALRGTTSSQEQGEGLFFQPVCYRTMVQCPFISSRSLGGGKALPRSTLTLPVRWGQKQVRESVTEGGES